MGGGGGCWKLFQREQKTCPVLYLFCEPMVERSGVDPWIFAIPNHGSASKNLSILIRVVQPGSGSRILILIFTHPGSQIQGSKRHRIPDHRSGTATPGWALGISYANLFLTQALVCRFSWADRRIAGSLPVCQTSLTAVTATSPRDWSLCRFQAGVQRSMEYFHSANFSRINNTDEMNEFTFYFFFLQPDLLQLRSLTQSQIKHNKSRFHTSLILVKILWLNFYKDGFDRCRKLSFIITVHCAKRSIPSSWYRSSKRFLIICRWRANDVKGIDRPFRRGVTSSLIRSLFINWRLGNFFFSF